MYSEVARKEAWCRGARAVADIGLFTLEEFSGERLTPETIGAVRMLQEGGHQFDIVDSESDFSPYRVLILPDAVLLDGALARKVTAFLEGGGKVIASFESGLAPDLADFALPAWGVRKSGDGAVDGRGQLVRGRHYDKGDYVDYVRAEGTLARGLRDTEYVIYMRGLEVEANEGAEVMARMAPAYFDRTWRHFCSHRQTPCSGELAGAAAVRTRDVLYFAHPLFRQYHQNAPRWCKTLLLNALEMLLPEPLLRHGGPSGLVATVNEQAEERRWVVHLLHYIPERRGQEFDVLEDVLPLHEVAVSVRTPGAVASVRCVPEGDAIAHTEEGGRLNFTLPKLEGHQMVEIGLA